MEKGFGFSQIGGKCRSESLPLKCCTGWGCRDTVGGGDRNWMANKTTTTTKESSWAAVKRERRDNLDEYLKSAEEYPRGTEDAVSKIGGIWERRGANAAACGGEWRGSWRGRRRKCPGAETLLRP